MNERKIASILFDGLRYLALVVCNCIPLYGHLALRWDLTEILLFYSLELAVYEIVMLPAFIIFAFQTGAEDGKNLFGKIRYAGYFMIFRLAFFGMTQMFVLHSAFAISATTAEPTARAVLDFLGNNVVAIALVCAEYVFGFYLAFIKHREHTLLSPDYYGLEYLGYPILFLVAVGLVNGAGVLLDLNAVGYQLMILVLVIVVKTAGQIAMQARKSRELLARARAAARLKALKGKRMKNDLTLETVINGTGYPCTVRPAEGGGVLLIIPDAGGRDETAPRHPEQSAWLKRRLKGYPGVKRVLENVWEFSPPADTAEVASLIRA